MDTIAIDPPFRRAAVSRQTAVEETRRGSILVGDIAPYDRAQLFDIEVGVLELKRIEGPLDDVDAPLQGVFALRQLQQPAHPAIVVLGQDTQHVTVEVTFPARFETGDGKAEADHP